MDEFEPVFFEPKKNRDGQSIAGINMRSAEINRNSRSDIN
jgi:hypothetical protein